MSHTTAMSPARPLVPDQLPAVVYVETTNTCNSLCQTCPLTFFGNGTPRHLTLDELQGILDQLPGLERVVLHGIGEPLLNRQLPEMIQLLTARGIHTLFNSNAIALTRRRQEELVASGLDELRVSLDAATPDTYQRIRGVPAHTKVVKHLTEMVATRDRLGSATPRVSVWFTTLRENLAELPAVAQIVAEAGADELYVQRLVYAGYGLAVEEQSLFGALRRDEVPMLRAAQAICAAHGLAFRASGDTAALLTLEGDAAQTTPEDEARPWLACRRPWYLTYITAHGDVLPCCFIPFVSASAEPTVVLGNVHRQTLADIWSGAPYQDFRARFQTDQPYDCCAGCGSRWSV